LCRCKLDARFAPNVLQAQKSFWMHPMALLGCEAQVEAHFSPFRDSALLTQDRCTVHAERSIGSKMVLDTSDAAPRGRGSCAISFGPFGDSVSVCARYVHNLRQT
jgi:hypothetical protein